MTHQNNLPRQDIQSLVIPLPENVNEEEPWSNDWLSMKSYADNLTEHITTWDTERLVMSIHGEWGSGKTFMLRRWHQQLINKGYIAVYINAWQDDFQDPLVAIIGQLDRQIKQLDRQIPSNDRAQKKMATIWKNANKIDILINFIGLINLIGIYPGIDKTIKIGEQLTQLVKGGVKTRYAQERKALEELRTALYQLAPKPQGGNQPAKPIVFIIDELDRCRPDYSVKMLERIKHLFEPPTKQVGSPENQAECSPGIRFVLGVNQTQLECSVRQLYGNDIDVENYLRRFFDVELVMHPVSPRRYCQYLLGNNQIDGIISSKIGSEPIECVSNWIEYMQFSLRQVEYFLRTLRGAWNAVIPNRIIDQYAIFFLIALRTKDRNQYRQYRAGKIKTKELIEYFSQFVPMLTSSEMSLRAQEEQGKQCSAYIYMERTIYGLTQTQDERTHIKNALESLKKESAGTPMTNEQREEVEQYLASTTIERGRVVRDSDINRIQLDNIVRAMTDSDRCDLDYPFRLVDTFKAR